MSVVDELAVLAGGDFVLDGEVAVPRPDGTCDFWALQQDVSAKDSSRLHYFVFDIICHRGEDVRHRPLLERKALLRELLEAHASPRLHFVDHVAGEGPEVWAQAQSLQR